MRIAVEPMRGLAVMESSGVPREEAEFIAAMELGEQSGDLIGLDEE